MKKLLLAMALFTAMVCGSCGNGSKNSITDTDTIIADSIEAVDSVVVDSIMTDSISVDTAVCDCMK